MPHQQREVRAHPHGDEEQPQQQPLERLDVGFELVPEFRVREEHAGEERAERHRQPDVLHRQRRTDHHEQRRGGEHLASAVARDEAQHRSHHEPARDDHHDDGRHTLGRRDETRGAGRDLVPEHRQQREQGNDGKVLEQQDRERGAAMRCLQRAALLERGQHQRRRRHREPEARDEGRFPRQSEPDARGSEREARDQDLCRAEPEHGTTQRPQPRGLELETDQEQQQHDPELRELECGLDVADQPQAPRADERAGREVAQHRAEPEAAEYRDEEHRGRKEYGGLFEQRHAGSP